LGIWFRLGTPSFPFLWWPSISEPWSHFCRLSQQNLLFYTGAHPKPRLRNGSNFAAEACHLVRDQYFLRTDFRCLCHPAACGRNGPCPAIHFFWTTGCPPMPATYGSPFPLAPPITKLWTSIPIFKQSLFRTFGVQSLHRPHTVRRLFSNAELSRPFNREHHLLQTHLFPLSFPLPPCFECPCR